jgi:hypothetical protein
MIKLIFSKRKDLIWGFMKVFSVPEGKLLEFFPARSGQADCQHSYWEIGRSPIPPSSEISHPYSVNLNGYCPGDVRAMGNKFFPIEPNVTINKDGRFSRSEIGMHADQNEQYAPGSAGCIVMHPQDFKAFDAYIEAFKKANPTVTHLSLTVEYW